jgi:hypothetical protein
MGGGQMEKSQGGYGGILLYDQTPVTSPALSVILLTFLKRKRRTYDEQVFYNSMCLRVTYGWMQPTITPGTWGTYYYDS